MLLREQVAVYCENHTYHTNALCEQTAELYSVKAYGTYSNHLAFKEQPTRDRLSSLIHCVADILTI
jgi:hypothetical protein